MQLRFLFTSPMAHRVAEQAVEQDARLARLSWKYRCYYAVRRLIPISIRHILQRVSSPIPSRDWFLPEASYRRLVQAVLEDGIDRTVIHPWPGGVSCGLVLTHDVETTSGHQHIPKILDLEEDLGFRSSWNFIPRGGQIDSGLLKEMRQRGFEIGVHGYNHDGRLFLSRSHFDRRCPEVNRALSRFGACGFRAPMVHRNLEWMQGLEVEYDASCFDIDPYQPMPGGVGMIWPFMAGRFVEIPYTMPQDHTIFVTLGETHGHTWHQKAAWLRQRQGLILMLTHPDYLHTYLRLGLYREFLESQRDQGDVWHGLPRQLARWWRQRDESMVDDTNGSIQGPAEGEGVAATVSVGDEVLRFEQATFEVSNPNPSTTAE